MILRYSEAGATRGGTPLVLLHAFPLNSRMWQAQLDELGSKVRIIAPDFRGYGENGAVDGPFSFETFAKDVRETLTSIGVDKAVFGGCSMGGYTIFELLRQAPRLFAGMILCDTRSEPDTEEAKAKRADQVQRLQERGADFMPRFVVENLLGEPTRRNRPDVVERVKEIVQEAPVSTIISTLKALAARVDSGPTLQTINVPTLIVVGENDTVTPLSASEHMERNIKDSKLVQIPRAGHLSPMENQEAVNAAIMDFFSRIA